MADIISWLASEIFKKNVFFKIKNKDYVKIL